MKEHVPPGFRRRSSFRTSSYTKIKKLYGKAQNHQLGLEMRETNEKRLAEYYWLYTSCSRLWNVNICVYSITLGHVTYVCFKLVSSVFMNELIIILCPNKMKSEYESISVWFDYFQILNNWIKLRNIFKEPVSATVTWILYIHKLSNSILNKTLAGNTLWIIIIISIYY